MNVCLVRLNVLTAVLTCQDRSVVCVIQDSSWVLMGNSAIVSTHTHWHVLCESFKIMFGGNLKHFGKLLSDYLSSSLTCGIGLLQPNSLWLVSVFAILWFENLTHSAGIEMEIVNGCEKNNGGCSHHCEHTTSGPLCSCNQGYQLAEDLKTCIGTVCPRLMIV